MFRQPVAVEERVHFISVTKDPELPVGTMKMSVPVLSSSPGRCRSSAKPSTSGEIQGRPVYFFFAKVLMMPYVGAVRMDGIIPWPWPT